MVTGATGLIGSRLLHRFTDAGIECRALLRSGAAEEAPATVYEMAAIGGYEYPPSAEPLTNPWRGQVDVALARRLGFRPTITTIHEAARLGRI